MPALVADIPEAQPPSAGSFTHLPHELMALELIFEEFGKDNQAVAYRHSVKAESRPRFR
jgi:hypothetical protein